MKKTMLLMVGLLLLLPGVGKAEPETRLFLNGQEVVLQKPVYITNGKYFIHAASLFEAAGLVTVHDSGGKTITARKEGLEVSQNVGEKTITSNGRTMAFDTASELTEGEVFIPMRMIAFSINAKFERDGSDLKLFLAE